MLCSFYSMFHSCVVGEVSRSSAAKVTMDQTVVTSQQLLPASCTPEKAEIQIFGLNAGHSF